MKYYIATGKVLQKLMDLDKERTDVISRRNAFVKSVGAKSGVTYGTEFRGVVFKEEIPKPWKPSKLLSKHIPEGCVPDNSKEGVALGKKMRSEEYTDPVDGFSVSYAVGVKPFVLGRPYTISSFTMLCGKVVVRLDDAHKPGKDLKRISDVEYENLLAEEKKSRKRKGG